MPRTNAPHRPRQREPRRARRRRKRLRTVSVSRASSLFLPEIVRCLQRTRGSTTAPNSPNSLTGGVQWTGERGNRPPSAQVVVDLRKRPLARPKTPDRQRGSSASTQPDLAALASRTSRPGHRPAQRSDPLARPRNRRTPPVVRHFPWRTLARTPDDRSPYFITVENQQLFAVRQYQTCTLKKITQTPSVQPLSRRLAKA